MSRIELPDEWNMCVCTNEPALRKLRDVMALANEKAPGSDPKVWSAFYAEWSARREACCPGPLWELMMHFLEAKGWGEHGGGINSSWLTGTGEDVLAKLQSLDLG